MVKIITDTFIMKAFVAYFFLSQWINIPNMLKLRLIAPLNILGPILNSYHVKL